MRQLLTRTSQAMVDLAVLAIAYFLAVLLRFEGWPQIWMVKRGLLTWPYVVALQYLVLTALGVPRFAWSYVGLREIRRIVLALGIGVAVLFAVRYAAGLLLTKYYFAEYAYSPGGVIVLDF